MVAVDTGRSEIPIRDGRVVIQPIPGEKIRLYWESEGWARHLEISDEEARTLSDALSYAGRGTMWVNIHSL